MIATARSVAAAVLLCTSLGASLAACGGNSGSASPTLSITSPSEDATVGPSVQVAWTSSETLGPPSSGKDHVHVFVDGNSGNYQVVGGNSVTVTGLSPGKHTINVTLQHADHSSAGASAQVEVTVTGGGGGSPSPSSPTSSSTGGYGY